jgi:hypothetical protein
MGSVLYQPYIDAGVESQDEAIIHSIIVEENSSNVIGEDDIKTICQRVENSSKKERCYAQLGGSEDTEYKEDDLKSYWKAVGKGYSKDIDAFLKRKSIISKALGLATTGLGIFSGLSNKSTNQYVLPEKERMTPIIKIAVAVGIVAVGFGVYSLMKKK